MLLLELACSCFAWTFESLPWATSPGSKCSWAASMLMIFISLMNQIQIAIFIQCEFGFFEIPCEKDTQKLIFRWIIVLKRHIWSVGDIENRIQNQDKGRVINVNVYKIVIKRSDNDNEFCFCEIHLNCIIWLMIVFAETDLTGLTSALASCSVLFTLPKCIATLCACYNQNHSEPISFHDLATKILLPYWILLKNRTIHFINLSERNFLNKLQYEVQWEIISKARRWVWKLWNIYYFRRSSTIYNLEFWIFKFECRHIDFMPNGVLIIFWRMIVFDANS